MLSWERQRGGLPQVQNSLQVLMMLMSSPEEKQTQEGVESQRGGIGDSYDSACLPRPWRGENDNSQAHPSIKVSNKLSLCG